MDVQGAVDSLLGRLTTILVNEAQLLRGVRRDVVFIKDEMESMNSLLLHLTESQHRNRQVRTWMKHVVVLTRDCEGNVELYARYIAGANHHANKDVLSYLWWVVRSVHYLRGVVRFVLTVRARRRVATRIRELKVRARDVGDRRLRYGVTVPLVSEQSNALFIDAQTPREASQAEVGRENARRQALLDGKPPADDDTVIKTGIDQVTEWLKTPTAAGIGSPNLKVVPIVCKVPSKSKSLLAEAAARIANGVYKSLEISFDCKVLIDLRGFRSRYGVEKILWEILQQVSRMTTRLGGQDEARRVARKLQDHLKGNSFLIVLQHVQEKKTWDAIRDTLFVADSDCHPGSAIIMSTVFDHIAESSSPYKIFRAPSLRGFMYDRAEVLIRNQRYSLMENLKPILEQCYPDAFAMRTLLHLLYVNNNRKENELRNIKEDLLECVRLKQSVAKQMLMVCYTELPLKYKSCLLYLSIFPKGHIIKTASLVRRWIAEGLVSVKKDHAESSTGRRKHWASSIDEAESYLDVLVTRGFILPGKIRASGNIKSFTIHQEVHDLITWIATDVNFVDTDLPQDLARHLSIHSRLGLHLQASQPNHTVADEGNDIVACLPYLAKSSQWQLLKVLDLEGCKGLKKKHLKKICKILLLKYLSLRNTDVTNLPKQIERLRCLETLDIRQTAIRAFATKSIRLPMLKHLLVGQTDTPSNNSNRFQGSFVTMRIPSGIQKMEKLEILSHVDVTKNVSDLTGVGKLLQLRKLGVILDGNKDALDLLFQQTEKLDGCLRSLSIRINHHARTDGTLDGENVLASASHPKLLQSLNISGITSGLLLWIENLDQLTKITLSETSLEEDALRILGKLRILSCLKLRNKSYTSSELCFKEEEFKSLKSLVVESCEITKITFNATAAPKMEEIVWSFASMNSFSGLDYLLKLKKVEFNGECIPDPVRKAIEDHPNHPGFEHNAHHQQEEAGIVVAASTP